MNGLSTKKRGRCREVAVSRGSTVNQIHFKGGLYPGGTCHSVQRKSCPIARG